MLSFALLALIALNGLAWMHARAMTRFVREAPPLDSLVSAPLATKLRIVATGVELPGGGQIAFPGRRMVALYGHPGDPVLGVLGEQGLDAAIDRARSVAATYESLVDEPVIPAFEIITTVASASAGPDGNYSSEFPVDKYRPWVEAALEALKARGVSREGAGLYKCMYVTRADQTVLMTESRDSALAVEMRGRPGWGEPGDRQLD